MEASKKNSGAYSMKNALLWKNNMPGIGSAYHLSVQRFEQVHASPEVAYTSLVA